MFYIFYEKNGDYIDKYELKFDENEQKKLTNEIIENCSLIKHRVVTAESSPFGYGGFDESLAKNLNKTVIKEWFDRDGDEHCLLKYEFDEYIPPKLVYLIYSLSSNPSVIRKIYNYDLSNDLTIFEKIDELCVKISSLSDENKEKNLEELQVLLNLKEKNKNQKSISVYYRRLLNLFNETLLCRFEIKKINDVLSFLDIDLQDNSIYRGSSYARKFDIYKKVLG